MAESIFLFIDANAPLEQIVDHIASITALQFHKYAPAGEAFQARTPYSIITIFGDHGFENDRDMHFEDYQYTMEICAIRDLRLATNQDQTEQFAARLFEQLKATDRYALLLVWDLQQKLQEHRPRSRAV
jgi:hypothetical protein